jgi:hypothetical protein
MDRSVPTFLTKEPSFIDTFAVKILTTEPTVIEVLGRLVTVAEICIRSTYAITQYRGARWVVGRKRGGRELCRTMYKTSYRGGEAVDAACT